MDLDGVSLTALITIAIAVGRLFWKFRDIEKGIEDMVDSKISTREEIDKELQSKEDKYTDEVYKQIWIKITQLESLIQGNPKYKMEGLVMTVEKLKLELQAIKDRGDRNEK